MKFIERDGRMFFLLEEEVVRRQLGIAADKDIESELGDLELEITLH